MTIRCVEVIGGNIKKWWPWTYTLDLQTLCNGLTTRPGALLGAWGLLKLKCW